ncbi:hypothetical protein DERP_012217, partial [Dermatophagoides pteronyssinus]
MIEKNVWYIEDNHMQMKQCYSIKFQNKNNNNKPVCTKRCLLRLELCLKLLLQFGHKHLNGQSHGKSFFALPFRLFLVLVVDLIADVDDDDDDDDDMELFDVSLLKMEKFVNENYDLI